MAGPENSNCLRFGGFAVDLATGELSCHGARIPLQDKPFQILALLLRRPKQLVSRSEIIRTVWPDTFVEGDLCLNVAVRRLRSALNDDSTRPRFIETIGSRGYRFIGSVHRSAALENPRPDRAHPRVAVFPLKTLVGSESSTFGPALTELLITQLRQTVPRLVVVTPEFTTERTHEGRGTLTLCRHAAVDYVLVGAVSETAGQIRVNVRLLDCQAQACLWAQSYTNQNERFFAVQDEICQDIVSAVTQSLPNPLRADLLALAPTAARIKYVQACQLLSRLTEQSTERCIPLFDEAVREYPQFALAWAALANAYCALGRLGILPSRKAFPKVKVSADRAIQVEDLAQARTARAYYYLLYEHDWNATEADLVRALAIDTGYSPALGAYAQLLAILGRYEDAAAMMRRACELDPLSGYTSIMLGWVLYYAEKYDEALSQLDHAIELDPALWVGQITKGIALEEIGRVEEAVAQFRIAVARSENSAVARAHLACGLARSGDRAGAIEILDSLLKLRQKRYLSPYWIASIQVALNECSKALQWLETAIRERCGWLVFVGGDPRFRKLRTEPRFQQMLASTSSLRSVLSVA
jgi:serine/threonine-protein kinase